MLRRLRASGVLPHLRAGALVCTAVTGSLLVSASRDNPIDGTSRPDEQTAGRRFEQLSIGQAYLASLQTGDLIFFNPSPFTPKPLKFILSRLQRGANGGDFAHVGVVVRHPTHDFPYVLEHSWRGVQLVDFEDRVLRSSCADVMVRSLHMPRPRDADARALAFAEAAVQRDQATRTGASIGLPVLLSPRDSRALAGTSPVHSRSIRSLVISPSFPAMTTVAEWLRDSFVFARAALSNLSAERAAPPVRRLSDVYGFGADSAAADSAVGAGGVVTVAAKQFPVTAVSLTAELAAALAALAVTDGLLGESAAPPAASASATTPTLGQSPSPAPPPPSPVPTVTTLSPEQRLLRKRQAFLRERVGTLTEQLAARPHATPDSTPTFRDAALVAAFLQHIDVLPAHDSSPSVTPSVTPSAAAVVTPFLPPASTFAPHNFREGCPLLLARGAALSAEQFVTQGHHKPPSEPSA